MSSNGWSFLYLNIICFTIAFKYSEMRYKKKKCIVISDQLCLKRFCRITMCKRSCNNTQRTVFTSRKLQYYIPLGGFYGGLNSFFYMIGNILFSLWAFEGFFSRIKLLRISECFTFFPTRNNELKKLYQRGFWRKFNNKITKKQWYYEF